MKTIVHSFIFSTLCAALHAVEPGFIPLLDKDHTSGWVHCGPGKMDVANGEATLSSPKGNGFSWHSTQSFTDFVLKLEFQGKGREYNSGVFFRFQNPGNDPAVASKNGNEVAITDFGAKDQPTGSIYNFKDATGGVKPRSDWNDFEITVTGNRVVVSLNGQVINEHVGLRQPAGFVGLQSHPRGPVQFRNVRIRDLSSPAPTLSIPLASIQTDANQPRIEVIKDQGPNATEWALTPLDEAIPADIRQNLTFLREDLLDEGKKAAKSSPEAYKLASDYCDKILTALDQRDLARVNAGYRASQADADKRTSTQALDARRNHQMSWPQYAREESQRAALRENETDKADVKKERLKVDWATRSVRMRSYLDDLYRQLREAMR
jgi:hypothetical protein